MVLCASLHRSEHVAKNGGLMEKSVSESRLDQEARTVREELSRRKRARDFHRQKRSQQKDDALQRFFQRRKGRGRV